MSLRPAWYAVYTNIRCEDRARAGLIAKGFRVYLPVETRTIRHARKVETVNRPLFPRYLFVSLDRPGDCGEVRRTDGVEGFVCASPGHPSAIRPGLVERLMEAQDAGLFVHQPPVPLRAGEHVRIARGPLMGLAARITRLDRGRRAQLLLRMLGGSVWVPVGDLERVA